MDSQEKAQQLMHALMPFAEKMLTESGGFLPYAGVITPDDQIHLVQFAEDTDEAEAHHVYEHANVALRQGAQEGKWTTTALVTDVNVTKPGEEESMQAVSFALDDSEGNSVEVFFPYTIKEGAVDFGTAFAQQGAKQIFGEAGASSPEAGPENTGTE